VATLAADMQRIAGSRAVIASLVGRYFAMDRDHRWERTRRAFDLLVHSAGTPAAEPVQAIRDAYARGESDEFITPIALHTNAAPVAPLQDGDGVICFNYRSDRMRQILGALALPAFAGFPVVGRPALSIVTMTQYDETFPFPPAFAPVSLARILAEHLSALGRTQLRTAETEKYPHVTYFFNGGKEQPYPGEERRLVPSPKVATYDLAPEMSAAGVTDVLCGALTQRNHDFILCNFANADMVGHTGVPAAVIAAVETVDRCLGRVVAAAEASGTRLLITADHGNCELMIDPDTGGPHTAHTTNPVPFLAVNTAVKALRRGGALGDVAPTILNLLGLPKPPEMTGRALDQA
jgi:2,3-bisphosphoglycerate-independent phosphoglycerate mutase